MGNWIHKEALNKQKQGEQNAEIANPPQIENETDSKPANDSVMDPPLELLDPAPDVHEMFETFNQKFFWSQLKDVSVVWNKKMTYIAGMCIHHRYTRMSTIALSEPLLRLRPKKDLIDTLLHEMIHAYLCSKYNNGRHGHGPEFHEHMNRINSEAGTNISVYHKFHDEVKLYRTHWWRCDGPCRNNEPLFGIVKRDVNKPPGPSDSWWSEHFVSCGGTFIKVRDPRKDDVIPHIITLKNVTYYVDDKTKNYGESVNIRGFKEKDSKMETKGNSSSTALVKTDLNSVQPNQLDKADVPSRTGNTSNTKSTQSRESRTYYVHWNNKIIEIDTRKRKIVISYNPSSIPEKKPKVQTDEPTSS